MTQDYSKTVNGQQFLITTDAHRMQLDRIHHYLSVESYWSKYVPMAIVKRSVENSLCFGVFHCVMDDWIQIGFARVITDRATFAYLCDVYIEPDLRGQGLSKWMMECVQLHPDLQNLRRFLLATLDAHELYKKFGFEVSKTPERWMEIKNPDIYVEMNSGKKKSSF